VQDSEPASFTARLEALAHNSGDEGLEVWKIELQNGSATESAGEVSTSQTGVKVSNPIPSLHIPADASVGATPDQLLRALGMEDGTAALGALRVQRTRGAFQAAYPQVAPGTVVVRTPVGHGAGILVDASGWILTNAHCVSTGSTDPATGAQTVEIHLGRLQAGQMELDSRAFTALVYKKSEEKDLALVKLTNLPADIALTAIPLAPTDPVIGSDCVAIGHPAAGMLWTARSCEVANIGTWPEHQIDFVITRLQAKGSDQEQRLRLLASHMPRLKILISSCGLNPGDSGGPLVDTRGQLIGLTFAIPATDPSSSVSLDKFAYHVHVDEVREFLKERAEVPLLHVPNPWPPAAFSVLMDLDSDGAPETLAFGLVPNAPTTGLLVDLDQSFLPGFAVESLTEAGASDRLDFEFGWQPGGERRTFYDSNDDGMFDLTLVDLNEDGLADLELNLQGENWQRGRGSARNMEDASAVPAAMRQRYMHIMEVLRAQMQEK
jgi:S1-C subfamily serine protease